MNKENVDTAGQAQFEQRRQQLTNEILNHAVGARTKSLHWIRVGHAVDCGRALAQLKALLPHGHWDKWVKEECALSRVTAHRYIRLARNAERLLPTMTIREAYIATGLVSRPRGR